MPIASPNLRAPQATPVKLPPPGEAHGDHEHRAPR